MVAWRDSIDITVEVGFDTKPWAASTTWTDITAAVRNIPTIRRGVGSEYSSTSTSTLTVVVDNRDREFDPDYSSGTYYGKLLPMKRIRVQATLSMTTVTLFSGVVQEWQQHDRLGGDSTCVIVAADESQFLGRSALPGSCYESQVLGDDPDIYFPLQEGASPDSVRDIVFGKQLYATSFSTNAGSDDIGTPLTGTYPLGAASYYEPRGGADPNIVFRDGYGLPIDEVRGWSAWVTLNGEDSPATDAGDDSSFWLSVGSAASDFSMLATVYWAQNDGSGITPSIELQVFGYNNPTDNRYLASAMTIELAVEAAAREVHVAFTADTSNAKLYVNGQLVATTALTTGTDAGVSLGNFFQLGTGWSHLALWETAPTATQILEQYLAGLVAYGAPAYAEKGGARIGRILDDIGHPSARRNLSTGNSIHGPYLPAGGSAVDQIGAVVRGEQGLFFFDVDGDATFRDREWFWTDADSGVVFSDDGAGGAIRYRSATREGNSVATVRNKVTATFGDFGSVTRSDATSIDDYGPLDEYVNTPTLPSRQAAANIAAYVLRFRKDPSTRFDEVSANLRTASGVNEFASLLGLDIGDVITIERTPAGVGSQLVKKAMVRTIRHEITPAQWTVTLTLGPAPVTYDEAPYLVLGDATYGKAGAAFGNLIPA